MFPSHDQVWYESRNVGSSEENNYTFSLRTGEEHQSFSSVSAVSPNQETQRKIFDLTSFTIDCIGDMLTVEPKGNPNSYVFFKRVQEARGPIYDPETGLRTVVDEPFAEETDLLSDLPDGLLQIAEYLRDTISQAVQTSLRSYSEILSGSTSATKSAFYVVNKYEHDFENDTRGDLVQTYVIPESVNNVTQDSSGMSPMINLADTQVEYDRSYEYEVLQNTIVVGSRVKIKNLFLEGPPSTYGDVGSTGSVGS